MNWLKTVFLAFTLMFVPSCACWQADHANDKGCLVLKQEINCATDDVKALVPSLLPLLEDLFSGSVANVNTDSLITSLEAMGFKFVGCSLADLENDFVSKSSAGPKAMMLNNAHEYFSMWRRREAPNSKFCLVKDGKKVCL